MLDARFRPMPKWERTPGLLWRVAHFKTPYNKTLDKLEYEVRHLKGSDIRIEAGYSSENIRNDGWPRGAARPSHPGAVLYFESRNGSLCFPCGTYERFEDNLHAIALTLECLRAVDRYGVTVGNEQYRGFASLPPASSQMTVEGAAQFISDLIPNFSSNVIIESKASCEAAYKQAARRLHPDVTGGESERFLKLQEAKLVLQTHHKIAMEAGR